MVKVVHILLHGQALCGMPGIPSSWPDNHRWCRESEIHQNPCCFGCLAVKGIRDHYQATHGHEQCHENDEALWSIIGLGDPTTLPPKAEFMRKCEAYYEGRCPLVDGKRQEPGSLDSTPDGVDPL